MDLGISSVISFRLYQPISEDDVKKVGQLMQFFKKVYLIIALIIAAIGLSILPFLNLFIKDVSEVPSDVNIQVVYVLFLLQTLSSYVCVTPQMLLSADQKQYQLSLMQFGTNFLRYSIQFFSLFLTKNYTITLLVGILTTIVCNVAISLRIKNYYADVFQIRETIPKQERERIFLDTRAVICHKFGGTALSSTDNLVLSSFVGIVATGLYSNYSLIVSSLYGLVGQLFSSFTSTLGNAHFAIGQKKIYQAYRRLLFANFWFSGLCSACLFSLISDFITIWLGKEMVLGETTIIVICVQFYLESVRMISSSYTSGCGLFVRDKARPFIEACINLGVSILLAIKIGITGVFLGTVVSHIVTVTWREPYLLYKYEFKKSLKEYWILFGTFTIFTGLISSVIYWVKLCIYFSCANFGWWILEAFACIGFYTIISLTIFWRHNDMKFYIALFVGKWTEFTKQIKQRTNN